VTLVTLDYNKLNFSSGWILRAPWEGMQLGRINQCRGQHNFGKVPALFVRLPQSWY